MDDLAKRMRISKRTLYEHIASKEELIAEIIDLVFKDIREKQLAIANDPSLDLIVKIKKVVCLLPQNFSNINYNKIYEMKSFYPKQYRKIDEHLSIEWELTLQLFQAAIEDGKMKPVNVSLVRQIILGIFRNLFDDEFLLVNHITYEDALQQTVDMIFDGIAVSEDSRMKSE